MPKHPHIVVFNPDQFRSDALGHLGNVAVETPVLDRLVETDAVSFSQAFCQNPVCTPSRCSFMSGWYTHVRGHRTMHHMMHADEPVLLKTLKENDYFVWWGGKNDLVPGQEGWDTFCDVKYFNRDDIKPNTHAEQSWRPAPGEHGFNSFYAGRLGETSASLEDSANGVAQNDASATLPVYLDGDMDTVLAACEFIRTAPLDQPICVFLALSYPHPPYGVEEPFYSLVDRQVPWPRTPTPESWEGKPSLLEGISREQSLQDFTEAEWRELRAVYLGMCARIDYQLGLVIDALKDRGIYDETALFFFSDHGDFTGDYGLVEKTQNTFEECLTRVPFVIKPPSDTPVTAGVRDALVELVDFPATVEALTGIEPQHTHFGRSLLPLVAGETDDHRDAVFCEGGRLMDEQHTREKQSASSATTMGLYHPRIKWQIADGPEHGKAVMCRTKRYKYVRRLTESDELYDLETDPREQHNRIDDPALSDVLVRMKDRLLSFYLETADAVPFSGDERGFTPK